MSTQKFILRNRETGKIQSRWICHVTEDNNEILQGIIGADVLLPNDTHDLIPVGYVPLSAVREMGWRLGARQDFALPGSEVGWQEALNSVDNELQRLAKQYGAEDGK